jgi:peptide/nickel transport system substrate-binding protein
MNNPYGRALALLLAALAVVLLGCGGDDSEDRTSGGGGREGGSITISQSEQPDYLDPALTYTVAGFEPIWLVYKGLLAYPHKEGKAGVKLVPGLAEELPTISEDGTTYELTLRKGLRFSNGTPVRASDFEHTIKRVLNLESGGSTFFLGIQGAQEYVERGKANADIPGIDTRDRSGEITIRLTEPDGSFSYALAMTFAGLVPGDTPFEILTQDPPPGVGPYKFTESVPNRQFVLAKNNRFDLPGFPKGNVEKITTKIIDSDQRQAQDVISGKLDYMFSPPPPDLKPEIKAKYSDRYDEHAINNTYYVFMNVRVPPFDKKAVRDAVNYGVDKPALARLFAGDLTPGCSFLPPNMPGYDEALDTEDCPWGNPNEPPDLERARKLVADAGAEGADVTVWGDTFDPDDKLATAYADMLNTIGLDAKPKILDWAVFNQTVGNAKIKAQTGVTGWSQDFPHPKNFFFLVDGNAIQPTNNQNFGNVDDPEITAGIARLSKEPELTDEVADEWGELDRRLVEEGWIVPYGHVKRSTFLSERMDFENCSLFHPVYGNDYTSFCLK